MANLNLLQIIGRLTRDPVIRNTSSGKEVSTFAVAVNRFRSSIDGERSESTEFFECVAWGKLATLIATHCAKGSEIYVSGELQQREWRSGEQTSKRWELVAQRIQLLGGARRESPQPVLAGSPDAAPILDGDF